MGRPPRARTTKKAADAPALVVPPLAAEAQAEPAESKEEPSQAKAALKSRAFAKTQALVRERTLARAAADATKERLAAKMQARAKQAQANVQAKVRAPAHAKAQARQTRQMRGSVGKWGNWQSQKPDAKAMPPSLRPQPPATPLPPDQKEALWHVDGDQNNSDVDHNVLRHAASQAGWCHYYLTSGLLGHSKTAPFLMV